MNSRLVVLIASLAAGVGFDSLSAERTHAGQDMTGEGAWQIVPSPNTEPLAAGNTLLAVDALSATDVWAVGFHYNNPDFCTFCPAPLALHWDGTQWSLVETPTIPVPKVELKSVAAMSSDDVWAVGYSYNPDCGLCSETLIEHWDGTSWSVFPSPNPGVDNRLCGVSATSATDVWAVGSQWLNWSAKVPLILHYDGTTWMPFDLSQFEQDELKAVHALAPDDVWAVGPNLALHWDGTSWTQVLIPSEPDEFVVFTSVSGVASNDVWVVGDAQFSSQSGQTLSSARAFHWDGSTWGQVLYAGIAGQDSRFYDVHAIASDDVWAVGGQPGEPGSGVAFEYTTSHWDGVNWSTVDTPNQGVLYSVSASSSSDVWAVGFGFDSLGFSTGTYTLHYTTLLGCPADIDQSGAVGAEDLAQLLSSWGPCQGCPSDVNLDNVVDPLDLAEVLSGWGPCP